MILHSITSEETVWRNLNHSQLWNIIVSSNSSILKYSFFSGEIFIFVKEILTISPPATP